MVVLSTKFPVSLMIIPTLSPNPPQMEVLFNITFNFLYYFQSVSKSYGIFLNTSNMLLLLICPVSCYCMTLLKEWFKLCHFAAHFFVQKFAKILHWLLAHLHSLPYFYMVFNDKHRNYFSTKLILLPYFRKYCKPQNILLFSFKHLTLDKFKKKRKVVLYIYPYFKYFHLLISSCRSNSSLVLSFFNLNIFL